MVWKRPAIYLMLTIDQYAETDHAIVRRQCSSGLIKSTTPSTSFHPFTPLYHSPFPPSYHSPFPPQYRSPFTPFCRFPFCFISRISVPLSFTPLFDHAFFKAETRRMEMELLRTEAVLHLPFPGPAFLWSRTNSYGLTSAFVNVHLLEFICACAYKPKISKGRTRVS